jgi:hypothetical protein
LEMAPVHILGFNSLPKTKPPLATVIGVVYFSRSFFPKTWKAGLGGLGRSAFP